MSKVLINLELSEQHKDSLAAKFPNLDILVSTDKDRFPEYLKDTEVFVTFFRCPPDIFEHAHNLKWIQGISAGIDAMPLDEIKKRGTILTNGRGIHKIHMAEYAIASMINLARNFHIMFRNQIKHKWDRLAPQGEIYGSTLGILGLGSIGMEIAKKASFLGMRVIGIKSNLKPMDYVEKVYTPEDMDEVFKESDYIINLMPSNSETHKIINKDYFNLMKNTACFINMGRGKTVNEDDLIETLKNKRIRGFVTDVYYEEPLPEDSPLWDLDNVILTPHICGESQKYMDRALEIIEHNLDAYFNKNGTMMNVVDPVRGY